MNLQGRVRRLEVGRVEDAGGDDFSRKFQAAYSEIAATMAAHDFASVRSEIMAFLQDVNAGRVNYWSSGSVLSFLASRVLCLVHRAANGLKASLTMPPALAQAWREHDERLADAPPAERHKGSFDSQECADCGAEHPFLGRYEWSREQRQHILINRERLIAVCLVCGGPVGKRYSSGFMVASNLGH